MTLLPPNAVGSLRHENEWPCSTSSARKALTADPAVVESLRNRTANMYQPLGGTNVSEQMRAAFQRAQAATYA